MTVCGAPVAAGAVNTPPAVIEPSVVVHVTVDAGLNVPATTAVKVVLAVAVDGETVTLVTVEVPAAIVTVAEPDFVTSCVLVAVTVCV